MSFLQVTYHIDGAPEEAAARAEAVLLEQTVETPRDVALRHEFVRAHMMGSIREMAPLEDGRGLRVTLSLPTVTASVDAAQFLNVLFGNSSMHANVRLENFVLPEQMQGLFSGPKFGLEGLRAATDVQHRPLTATALKPVGLRLEEVAALCRTVAEGGIDLVKDDHYLADHPFCPFEDRVRACLRAVDEAAERTGRRTVYVPNLSGTPDQVRRQLDFAQAQGVGAVMLAPMLLGLPFFYELVHERLEVPVLAHPSFAGSTRIAEATLYGKLLRLYGADAVIFANYGGRFSFPQETCGQIAETLRQPWGPYRPALPVPAGGMQTERATELVTFFGLDVMLLIGGSLLSAGPALRERTREFIESVERAALTLST